MLFLYDYFCILWNIHLTHARSCSCRHSLSWVVFYAVVRSWACVSVPIIGAGTREIWTFWKGLVRRLGKFGALFGRVYRPFGRRHLWGDSLAWSWVPGRVVGRWLQWSACWSRGARGRRCRMGFVWRTVSRIFSCFGDSEDLGACVMVSTGRWGLCAFCCWC